MRHFERFGAIRLKTALARRTACLAACALATSPAWALPAEVLAALARAGVPQGAISVVVSAIPSTSPATSAPVDATVTGTANMVMSTVSAVLTAPPPAAPRLSHRADASSNPASVMKLVTTYAALDSLGPAYTWKNRVYVDGFVGQNGQSGVLDGNLVIRGSGDPKLVLERIQDLFAKVQAKGVREVRGDIILDRSIFTVPDKNPADFDDEPLRPYNAAPDGLLVNFKSLIFTFTPDAASQRVLITSEPPIAGVEIPTEMPLSAGACGNWRSALQADFFTPHKVSFAGRFASACGPQVWAVAYSEPRAYAGRVIEAMWRASGGALTGKVREDATPRSARALLTADSLPLGDIIADVNKFSNNVMAQQVFLTLSAQGRKASFEASKKQLAAWWKKVLPNYSAPVVENGSGLSRKERTSAQALTGLLHHAAASQNAAAFASSLGTAGVDGTVARMRERNPASEALGNAQLKTGTLRDVAAVAGYATGRSGQRYSIVAIINHPNASAARPALDKLVEWTIKEDK
jgi:serine-type D-Ala-D-Ala carboxypeptidase/endopeptidase (penicillin-binding protein 4)